MTICSATILSYNTDLQLIVKAVAITASLEACDCHLRPSLPASNKQKSIGKLAGDFKWQSHDIVPNNRGRFA